MNNFIKWTIILLLPLVLIMTAIRLLMTPQFVQFEYNTPNFPLDSYGFTQEDRLAYAPVALEYLLNDADLSYFDEFRLEDGAPMYNERELGHLLDVKKLTQRGLDVWYVLLIYYVGVGIYFHKKDMIQEYKSFLGLGGKITVLFILVILLIIAMNFEQLFITFHRVFFEGDTWLFYFSDTLIRLFPMRFWQDSFILMGLMTLSAGGALWYFYGKRSP